LKVFDISLARHLSFYIQNCYRFSVPVSFPAEFIFINTIALYPVGPEISVHTPKLFGFSSGPFIFAMLGVVVNTGTKSIAAKKPTVFNFEMEVSTLV